MHFDLTVGLFSETRTQGWVLRLADEEESEDVDKGVQDHAAHDGGGVSGIHWIVFYTVIVFSSLKLLNAGGTAVFSGRGLKK